MIETLFYFTLIEVVLGGGGRIFAIGSLTARMILFGACILAWLSALLTSTGRRDGQALALSLVFLFVLSLMPGLTVDASQGTDFAIVAQKLQPLLFWLAAPFIAMALQNGKTVQRSAIVIMYGGLVVALITLLLMAGLQFGFIPFGLFYGFTNDIGELYFRGVSTFFYKGHFYVGVALVFCIILRPRWWQVMCAILAASLVLSLTRGLYAAVLIAVGFSLVSSRRSLALMLMALVVVVVAGLYSNVLTDVVFDPSRVTSSQVRLNDLAQFMATLDFNRLVFGDGTGVWLNGRSDVENSFISVLWRFGIAGLTFLLVPLFICLRYFLTIPFGDPRHRLASAFFYGVVMLYVVTMTNPFINNSIGILYLICALFSLRRLILIHEKAPTVLAAEIESTE